MSHCKLYVITFNLFLVYSWWIIIGHEPIVMTNNLLYTSLLPINIYDVALSIISLIFGKIKYVKDEIVTSTGFTNATPQRKVLFIDRVTG